MSQIKKVNDIINFIIGGTADFNLTSNRTGKMVTLRVAEHSTDPKDDIRFVFYEDETGDWNYLCVLDIERSLLHSQNFNALNARLTTKSPHKHDINVIAFQWLIKMLNNNVDISKLLTFEHMGICSMCGRTLTNPESIERGIGPVCAGRV